MTLWLQKLPQSQDVAKSRQVRLWFQKVHVLETVAILELFHDHSLKIVAKS